eukprot:scaffold46949_cov28-Phaeocystis_antarctica.AAC.1
MSGVVVAPGPVAAPRCSRLSQLDEKPCFEKPPKSTSTSAPAGVVAGTARGTIEWAWRVACGATAGCASKVATGCDLAMVE